MGFLDIFRPKWRHSNPDVRAEAVRFLNADDLDILSRVAKVDPDVRVRRLALKKIEDPEILDELAKSESDVELRESTKTKASELWLQVALGDDEGEAIDAVDKVGQPKELASIA